MTHAARAGLFSCFVLAVTLQAQEAPKKQVKDQGEYDLLTAVNNEKQPAKKLELLEQWKTKYPGSDFKEERAQVFVQTYQQLGNAPGMWTACEDLLQINPKSPLALMFLTSLVLSMSDTSPARLDAGEKHARQFLAVIPELYASAKGDPAAIAKERLAQESLARKALGFIAMARKDWAAAEAVYTDFLKANPNSGNVSYQLGNAMIKTKEKQIPALWHLARAAHYAGEDAMPEAGRKQLQAFLEKSYTNYHGSADGLKELSEQALKEPFPPASGWTILSKHEIEAKQDEEFKQKDPLRHAWLSIKKGLQDPATGDKIWEDMKGAALPRFKGKVVAVNTAPKKQTVMVAVLSDSTPEFALRMDPVFPNKAEPGTEIEFEGAVPQERTADPFLITADMDREKISGWPDAPKPAPRAKPAAAKKRPARKK